MSDISIVRLSTAILCQSSVNHSHRIYALNQLLNLKKEVDDYKQYDCMPKHKCDSSLKCTAYHLDELKLYVSNIEGDTYDDACKTYMFLCKFINYKPKKVYANKPASEA